MKEGVSTGQDNGRTIWLQSCAILQTDRRISLHFSPLVSLFFFLELPNCGSHFLIFSSPQFSSLFLYFMLSEVFSQLYLLTLLLIIFDHLFLISKAFILCTLKHLLCVCVFFLIDTYSYFMWRCFLLFPVLFIFPLRSFFFLLFFKYLVIWNCLLKEQDTKNLGKCTF